MLYNGRAQNGAGMKRLVSHFLRLSTRNTPNSAFCYILYIYIYIYISIKERYLSLRMKS